MRAALGHGAQQQDSNFERVAAAASGLAYVALCVTAVKILVGASSSGGANSPKNTTGGVLEWTGGTTIVAVIGSILVGVALYQGYKGVSRKFLEDSNTAQMGAQTERAFTALGVFGHLARMVIFGLAGYGLIKAAMNYDPNKAIGHLPPAGVPAALSCHTQTYCYKSVYDCGQAGFLVSVVGGAVVA